MNNRESRPYRSQVRDQQSLATQERIAVAAAELFVQDGYTSTSVAAVARHAGVAPQTVYNAFGTKAALLKRAYDIRLVGDSAPIPLAERPEVKRLYDDPDPRRLLRGYARLGRALLDRVGPLLLQISAGALAGEADLVAHRKTTDRERLAGTEMVARRVDELGALAPGLGIEPARDRLWTLNSVEVWHLLTRVRGWSGDDYQDWIGEAMSAAVLD